MNQIVQGVTVSEPKTGASTAYLAALNKLLESPARRPQETRLDRRDSNGFV
jgi:hypothetical protein